VSSKAYMQGRSSFLQLGARPQAMLWSDNPGTLQDSFYFPLGQEGTDFIIVSDHNRSAFQISQERIENKKRMVNGGLRSYWIADKNRISSSWTNLPSRPFNENVSFNSNGNPIQSNYTSHTVDGAAGGADMLAWYENTKGPFYLFLSYDKFGRNDSEERNILSTYSQVIKVHFDSFSHSVEKRSGLTNSNGFDFWNIELALEEA